MRRLIICLMLILLAVPLISSEMGDSSTTGTIAKVYVEKPNFEVLKDSDYDIITVVKDAPLPEASSGSLIRLESDNLDDLEIVLENLNTKKVVFFEEDLAIAVKLKTSAVVSVI